MSKPQKETTKANLINYCSDLQLPLGVDVNHKQVIQLVSEYAAVKSKADRAGISVQDLDQMVQDAPQHPHPQPPLRETFRNRLNDLDGKTWLKFQKSWFVHGPPPRNQGVLRHPAKFPETLVQSFVEFFTKAGQTVLDPMAGTGSAIVACLRAGRHGIGIELNHQYATIARQSVWGERANLGAAASQIDAQIIEGDAREISTLGLDQVDYVITSPPYWDMLRVRGAKTQEARRATADLDVFYSDDPRDLGNLGNYDEFVDQLCLIYEAIKPLLRDKAYLTIIVKNIKKGGRIYPLAWDIGKRLGKTYALKDERIWCQDDIRLAPYGMGSAWVSNTFHHYCLQFRKE